MTNVISVSGQSSLVKEPDCAVLKIEIRSSKNNHEESNHSISRRLDYINQVLRLHEIQKHNVITKISTRVEDPTPAFADNNRKFKKKFITVCSIEAKLEKDIRVDDVRQKIWEAHNVLLEKIGSKNHENSSVTISKPIFTHSEKEINRCTRKVGGDAVKNAKMKAIEWADSLGGSCGDLIGVREAESKDERKGDSEEISFFCKVDVTFKLRPK